MKWKTGKSDIVVKGYQIENAKAKVSTQQNAKNHVRKYGNGK